MIIAKNRDKGGDFVPAPQGVWPAVCVDVVDKGMVESAMYKPRHMVQLRWVLEAESALPDGRPHMAVRQFGLSLGEQSHLRPFLEAWRGKKFTDEELAGFDLEKLIGAQCQLQIIHSVNKGITYGNVQAAFPLGKNAQRVEMPKDYVRAQDRPDYVNPSAPVAPEAPPAQFEDEYAGVSDDDIPF